MAEKTAYAFFLIYFSWMPPFKVQYLQLKKKKKPLKNNKTTTKEKTSTF